jgi:hypothetical protein
LIVAGDVAHADVRGYTLKEQFFREASKKYKYVLFTYGNHDFYGSSLPITRDDHMNLIKPFNNVMILDNTYTTINGRRFGGSTLWYEPKGDEFEEIYHRWPDYNRISDGSDYKQWLTKENEEQNKFLNQLTDNDVLISHMMPTRYSVHADFKFSDTNHFFICEQTPLLMLKSVTAIHGHTHYPFDYTLGKSRIYCNPRAYPYEGSNENFKKLINLEL